MAKKQELPWQERSALLIKAVHGVNERLRPLFDRKVRYVKALQDVCRHPEGIETEESTPFLDGKPKRMCVLCGLKENRRKGKMPFLKLRNCVSRKLSLADFLAEAAKIRKTLGYDP